MGGLRITLSTHATYTLINVVFFSPGLKSAPSLALIFSLSLSLSLSFGGGWGVVVLVGCSLTLSCPLNVTKSFISFVPWGSHCSTSALGLSGIYVCFCYCSCLGWGWGACACQRLVHIYTYTYQSIIHEL